MFLAILKHVFPTFTTFNQTNQAHFLVFTFLRNALNFPSIFLINNKLVFFMLSQKEGMLKFVI